METFSYAEHHEIDPKISSKILFEVALRAWDPKISEENNNSYTHYKAKWNIEIKFDANKSIAAATILEAQDNPSILDNLIEWFTITNHNTGITYEAKRTTFSNIRWLLIQKINNNGVSDDNITPNAKFDNQHTKTLIKEIDKLLQWFYWENSSNKITADNSIIKPNESQEEVRVIPQSRADAVQKEIEWQNGADTNMQKNRWALTISSYETKRTTSDTNEVIYTYSYKLSSYWKSTGTIECSCNTQTHQRTIGSNSVISKDYSFTTRNPKYNKYTERAIKIENMRNYCIRKAEQAWMKGLNPFQLSSSENNIQLKDWTINPTDLFNISQIYREYDTMAINTAFILYSLNRSRNNRKN